MNYYNDNDKFMIRWLKSLIKKGLIPDGEVDGRPIEEVDPKDLTGFKQCHFFAGIGGWPYALQLAGWPSDRPVWTGSCPCQPFSCAGKGKGIDDERHLWPAFRWLISQRRPPVVFGEQVASKDGRQWLAGVRSDLEILGYAVGAADLPAASVGAPHKRNRLFWVAHACSDRWQRRDNELPARGKCAQKTARSGFWSDSVFIRCADGKSKRIPVESAIFMLLSDGISAILGTVWDEGRTKLKAEVNRYAKKANSRSGKILFALWSEALQKTIQRSTGRHGEFSTTEILLVALCQLAGDTKWEYQITAQDIIAIQESTMRALRKNPGKITALACPPYQRGLDGSQVGESANVVCVMPPKTPHEASNQMQSLREKGEKTQDVSKTLSKIEKIWRSIADKEIRWAKKMEDCQGWCDGLTRFPLCGSFPGRAGLLRGAGNSIVPQVAAEFIKAFMEV